MENLILLAEVAVRVAEQEQASTSSFPPPHNIASSSGPGFPLEIWPKRKRSQHKEAAADSRKVPAIYLHPCFSMSPAEKQQEARGVRAQRRLLDSRQKSKEKKIRAKKTKKPFRARENQPELPVSVELRDKIAAIGGAKIKLVINKEVQESDLNKTQTRLSMPKKQAGEGFLEEKEKSKVEGGIPVKLLEPCGIITEMELKIWKLSSSENYVVKTGEDKVTWREVVEREENKKLGVFEEGNEIRVWSFRVEGQLWLAIEKVEEGEAENGGGQQEID